jgi:glycosyltransferase involved in cell wall biosynthesis
MTCSVSVIIPTRNRAALLREAIASVRAEASTRFDVQILVVDDGSSDETAQLLETLQVARVEGPRRGVSAARNTGIAAATGDYVTFLDDDDVWLAGGFSQLLELLDNAPTLGAAVAQVVLTDAELTPTSSPYPDPPFRTGWLFESFLGYIPQVASILVRREVLLAVGGFDESLQGGEDWDWALRLARAGEMGFLPAPVLLWRMHDLPRSDGAGNRRFETVTWQRFSDMLKVGRRYLVGQSWRSQLRMERMLLRHRGHYVPLFVRHSSLCLERGEIARAVHGGWLAFKVSPLHLAAHALRAARRAVRSGSLP